MTPAQHEDPAIPGFEGAPLPRPSGPRRGLRAAAMAAVVGGAFTLGVAIGGHGSGLVFADSSLTSRPEFATLEQTWDLIHSEWAAPADLDDSALIYGAAAGMVNAIGDEGHSTFLDPEQTIEFEQATEKDYVGIGVEVDSRCGVPVVAATMEDSPARAAGLLPGDVIAEINGESTHRMTGDKLRELVLGKAGDPLSLTIERPGTTEPMKITVVRQSIARQPVTWRWLPDKTVQLRVTGFEPGVNQQVRDALGTIREQGAQRLILDLRGNPGGLVPEVIGVASQFLDEGSTIFLEQGREGDPKPVKTIGRTGKWLDLALVVLIDGQSASGAEVLAAALHDNHRAELVGETTFGTGTVLTTFPQDDGSSVVLGTAFWLTPDGTRVWQKGVEPDELVSLPPDAFPSRPEDDPELTNEELEKSSDGQLRTAYDALEGTTLAHQEG